MKRLLFALAFLVSITAGAQSISKERKLYEQGMEYFNAGKPKALKCFKKAAKLDYKPAQLKLAKMYLYGFGNRVKPNMKKGMYWINMAMGSWGDDEAECVLGDYFRSKGSHDDAVYWYENAAKHGNKKAIEILKEMKSSK